MDSFTHDFKMLRNDPFCFGFQIRKLEPSFANGGSSRRFFFCWGVSVFHFVREQDQKEKQRTFQFQTTKMSPSKEQTLENMPRLSTTMSIFNNIHGYANKTVHPWRLTWSIIMEVWKIIFLSTWVICRFHVNLPGCIVFFCPLPWHFC